MPETTVHRLFVAVPLPHPVKRALAAWGEDARNLLPFRKWVHIEDFHITVQFLGDASPARKEAVSQALRETARDCAPFELRLGNPGVFGRSDNPSILWVGVGGETAPLIRLQRRIAGVMAEHGFAAEERAYKPHITVARQYTGTGRFDKARLERLETLAVDWTSTEVVLFESHLQRRPMYEAVATAELTGCPENEPIPAL